MVVFIGMKTGMRKGEVLGRSWENVDFKIKKIRVAQQLTDTGELKDPKSRAGFCRSATSGLLAPNPGKRQAPCTQLAPRTLGGCAAPYFRIPVGYWDRLS